MLSKQLNDLPLKEFKHKLLKWLREQCFYSLKEFMEFNGNGIRLGVSVVPACLDVFGGDHYKAVATGWGATSFLGDVANTLQKVTLTEFTDRECSVNYPVKKGSTFNNTIQVCYGDYSRKADTCQGDSGGPLTILNHRLHCMYTVVGITSIGVNCGTPGQPGWYTKVSHYVPWIESIVWP
ncbi:hypothetical protein MSG28_014436 [Choristoneura fumiferana]|uniref:Uncharacterized protein n=1 Tax=Choristoneura fumiferana TaxID=7141 RepID=A0ACC0JRG0_CHOFU|nr:hypothetical protein MSG28_014436 [Choristoneura fumiferana]